MNKGLSVVLAILCIISFGVFAVSTYKFLDTGGFSTISHSDDSQKSNDTMQDDKYKRDDRVETLSSLAGYYEGDITETTYLDRAINIDSDKRNNPDWINSWKKDLSIYIDQEGNGVFHYFYAEPAYYQFDIKTGAVKFTGGQQIILLSSFTYDNGKLTVYMNNNQDDFLVFEKTDLAYDPQQIVGGKCGENAYWDYHDGILTISGSGDMYDFDLSRDSTMTLTIGTDDDFWSNKRRMVSEVVISDGITSIGTNALNSLISMQSISMPNTLQSIGNSAFMGCKSIKHINYNGTREQWEKVQIHEGNELLTQATIHFNETKS